MAERTGIVRLCRPTNTPGVASAWSVRRDACLLLAISSGSGTHFVKVVIAECRIWWRARPGDGGYQASTWRACDAHPTSIKNAYGDDHRLVRSLVSGRPEGSVARLCGE